MLLELNICFERKSKRKYVGTRIVTEELIVDAFLHSSPLDGPLPTLLESVCKTGRNSAGFLLLADLVGFR